MPPRKILRASYKVLTTPIYLLESLIFITKYNPIISDYEKCIETIEKTIISKIISKKLIDTLVIAEDHRNALHYGVDQIAIARTIKLKLTKNISQGASTIEQQLVRTITRRYEKTLRRKIREQLIATMISKKYPKERLCKTYLSIAYYGHKQQGTNGLKAIIKEKPTIKETEIISLLKYPKKSKPCKITDSKISRRSNHIEQLLNHQNHYLFLPHN